MGKIILEGMEFFAYHGCYHEEQVIGTKFIVDLTVETDTSVAEANDHLKDTLSYVSFYHVVKKEMEEKSHLLEHVAGRIMNSLKHEFPQLTTIELKISKVNPPVGGKMQKVGFALSWQKQIDFRLDD
jgi:7,8-dihydroneopterin aldolase/epimerase/oxygenase